MRKKTWDYIQMGLRNKESIKQKKEEEEERLRKEAKAFNKTFTDKTYSVAKKVIENVEKVSRYDYEKLIDRVINDVEHKVNNHGSKMKINVNINKKNKNIDVRESTADQKDSVSVVKSTAEKKNINEAKDEFVDLAIKNENMNDIKSPVIDKTMVYKVPLDDDLKSKKVIKKDEASKDVENHEDSIESHKKVQVKPDDFEEKLRLKREKENRINGQRYYKTKKREKFAKKMKVELDDNLLVQQKRSLTRLFKFSLAFKLSFVFIFLMIITIITLSVGFYFGIDFVVDLKEAGRLDDIQLFKNVLLVLLILFNFSAVLLYLSVGSKASRGLLRPLDEMTKIVKQINGEAMDRRLNVTGMHDELKELALTFNEMLERIELAYETQNRFTSDASHELRTPIAVIQGYVNMLDRWGKADGEVLDESIDAIKSEASNMKRLTEKLLLLAKADKGILEMNFETFSLKLLIEELIRETQMIDKDHDIVNVINGVDLIVGDRPSLKQALRIFLDNAVKYTPEGGKIGIDAYYHKKEVCIEISDNGIGISEQDMKQVFNRFYRADPSRAKSSGGHGLGLSIAKWIIKEHKGELEIKSELNKGTVVTIFLASH